MPEPKRSNVVNVDRAFFAVHAARLARRILGCTLVRVLPDGTRLSGIIVETEAYVGVDDDGSHARGGRRTPKNESMYADAGTVYVYFTYGMHYCMNVVSGTIDQPEAVLIRALEPVDGIAFMQAARKRTRDQDLCSGPGKLCQALAIDRSLDRSTLLSSGPLFIERQIPVRRPKVATGPRIGLSCGGRWAAAPLRFWLPSSSCISG